MPISDLDAILVQSWQMLAEGVSDRHSPMHTPCVATIGQDGRPRLRTVVLRGVYVAGRQLRFHTDRRSDKVSELQRDPRFSLHAYDRDAKVQLRVEGRAILHMGNVEARAAWTGSRPFSRICYGINPGPGAPIPTGDAFTLPATDAEVDTGFDAFCAVIGTVETLEWLYLAAGGNRRAHFAWDGAGHCAARWLTP